MTSFETKSHVGPDGKLLVNLPASMANTDVRVRVEPLNGHSVPEGGKTMTRAEWRSFIRSSTGVIADPTFRRHPQGEPEQRKALD